MSMRSRGPPRTSEDSASFGEERGLRLAGGHGATAAPAACEAELVLKKEVDLLHPKGPKYPNK